MSAPFAAMAAAVDIIRTGPGYIEAWGRQTGDVLGTARLVHVDGMPIGWLVRCGSTRQLTSTSTTARFVLLDAASKLDGVR